MVGAVERWRRDRDIAEWCETGNRLEVGMGVRAQFKLMLMGISKVSTGLRDGSRIGCMHGEHDGELSVKSDIVGLKRTGVAQQCNHSVVGGCVVKIRVQCTVDTVQLYIQYFLLVAQVSLSDILFSLCT